MHLQPSGVLDIRCERPTERVRSREEGDLMMLCSVRPFHPSLIPLFHWFRLHIRGGKALFCACAAPLEFMSGTEIVKILSCC